MSPHVLIAILTVAPLALCVLSSLARRHGPCDGDGERLAKVHAALEIWEDRLAPRVSLTDAVGSSVVVWLGRGGVAHLRVSRRAIDADEGALLGELAHEYAHVIDPGFRGAVLRQQCAAFALAFAAPVITFAVFGIRPASLLTYALVWEAQCVAAIVVAVVAAAPFNRARELRTDAAAATLLGDVLPVIAFLHRLHLDHVERSLGWRLLAALSHPSPARRRRALIALAGAAPPPVHAHRALRAFPDARDKARLGGASSATDRRRGRGAAVVDASETSPARARPAPAPGARVHDRGDGFGMGR